MTAASLTVPLIVSTALGCLYGLISAAPSEPCRGGADAHRLPVIIGLPMGAAMALTAVLSIALAWWGATRPRPWPYLGGAVLGLLVSAGLLFAIFQVLSC
ncbi:hypothetical protein KRMM14A1259_56500 [Krasilnikovia sp. MM14-A1259]